MSVQIEDQISEIEREIGMRLKVYPRWVAAGKMSQKAADLQLERMRAARATLVLFAEAITAKQDLKMKAPEGARPTGAGEARKT
jgi:hypothetical protein